MPRALCSVERSRGLANRLMERAVYVQYVLPGCLEETNQSGGEAQGSGVRIRRGGCGAD